MSTAALVHLVWYRTATQNVETVVASLDAQSTAAVRNALTSNLALVSSSAEIIRSVFFQGAVRPDDEVKREFLFLSLLREQPAIAWIGFGFPDGRFFGSHAMPDGEIEMVEIGAAAPGKPRPLRRDLYKPIPGDIFFENRLKSESVYVSEGSPWYRRGSMNSDAAWTVVSILPNGFEPAIVVSKRVEVFKHFEGVVMVAVSLNRLSATLSALKVPKGSKPSSSPETIWYWRHQNHPMVSWRLISRISLHPTLWLRRSPPRRPATGSTASGRWSIAKASVRSSCRRASCRSKIGDWSPRYHGRPLPATSMPIPSA
ncbi:hypothetical protein [Rhizobium sp. BK456]|uniref:hypothetical protein n=1 Tax=Rhizobium sp. BK456 TaxID=2587007 RepID=UPI001FED2D99|nr:hypothetical protein [Rhizobium sp. BK456]